jgi:hypothetical protein
MPESNVCKGLLHAPADPANGTQRVHYLTPLCANETIALRYLANKALKELVNDRNPNVPWQTKDARTYSLKERLSVIQTYADTTTDSQILEDWKQYRSKAGYSIFFSNEETSLQRKPVFEIAGEQGREQVTAT